MGEAQVLLGVGEHVVPEPGFLVGFDLRQVEVRAAPLFDERRGVVEEVQSKVHQASGCRNTDAGAVDEVQVLLHQVPPTGAHHDGGRRALVHRVVLSVVAGIVQRAAHGVEQGQLAADHVVPGGTRGVFLVGEPHVRAGVQRVDRHLPVGWSGDLHAAVFQTGTGPGDAPAVIRTDVLGFGEEAQVAAVVQVEAALHPLREDVVTAAGEPVVQVREEAQCVLGEDLVVSLTPASLDLDSWFGAGIALGVYPGVGPGVGLGCHVIFLKSSGCGGERSAVAQ